MSDVMLIPNLKGTIVARVTRSALERLLVGTTASQYDGLMLQPLQMPAMLRLCAPGNHGSIISRCMHPQNDSYASNMHSFAYVRLQRKPAFSWYLQSPSVKLVGTYPPRQA